MLPAFVHVLALLLGGSDLVAQNPLGQTSNPQRQQEGNPLARPKADPLVGRWQGAELSVTLQKDGARYRGHFELAGSRFPLTARPNGQGIEGSFEAEGEQYPFTAVTTKRGMTFHSGGSDYAVTKVASPDRPENLLADDGAATNPGVAATTRSAPRTKSFRHPLGFEFQHPEKWRVESSDDGIVVVPDEVKRDPSGQPLELFLISAEDAAAVDRPDQAEVLSFFDQSLAQMLPGMKRKAQPEALACLLGQGAVLRYSGRTPTNMDGHADIYLTLHNGLGVYMMHLGRKDQVERHKAEARHMFSTFGWQKGQTDPNLIALWHRNDFSSSSSVGLGGSMDSVGSSTNTYWQFNADGTVTYTSGSRLFGNVGGAGSQVSIDSGADPGNTWRGTWSVNANKGLTLIWNGGGAETYEYVVFDHTEGQVALKLTAPGEKKGTYYIRQ
ncbi:MAG: hypothetical protein ACI8QZ_003279 [Chlamydiales bacterium]|jgi:hypothetical protein